MKLVAPAVGGVIALILSVSPGAAVAAQAQPTGGDAVAAHHAVLQRYCVPCHNERNKTNAGGMALDSADLSRVGEHAELWEKVIVKLRAGLMPPARRPRPEPAVRTALVGFLETALDRRAAEDPNPGRTEAFHRLNRAEYRNAVRDLLGIEIDVAPLLPADDASYGFDNIAGVLKISQSRVEQYMTVARRISRAAIGASRAGPQVHEFRVPETTRQYDRAEGLPFGTRGGMLVRHHFPQDGEYEFEIDLLCRIGGECDGSVGFSDAHRLLVLVDDRPAAEFLLEPRMEMRPPEERVWRTRIPLKAGAHDIAVTFAKLPAIREIDSAYQRFLRPYFLNGVIGHPHNTIYQPFLDAFRIVGPFDGAGPGRTETRQRVFSCYPRQPADGESCAQTDGESCAQTKAGHADAGAAGVPPAGHQGRHGAADGRVRSGCRGRRVRSRHRGGAPGAARQPRFPVPQRQPPGHVRFDRAVESPEPLRERLEGGKTAPHLAHMPAHALGREHPHAVGAPHDVHLTLPPAVRREQPLRAHPRIRSRIRSRAWTLRWPSPWNGERARSLRMAASSCASDSAGVGPRRAGPSPRSGRCKRARRA